MKRTKELGSDRPTTIPCHIEVTSLTLYFEHFKNSFFLTSYGASELFFDFDFDFGLFSSRYILGVQLGSLSRWDDMFMKTLFTFL